jgi:hypothetical protein
MSAEWGSLHEEVLMLVRMQVLYHRVLHGFIAILNPFKASSSFCSPTDAYYGASSIV